MDLHVQFLVIFLKNWVTCPMVLFDDAVSKLDHVGVMRDYDGDR